MTQDNQCLYVACSRCGQLLKELTDEDIDTVWFSYKGDIKDFARAILKKASEK
jgi:cytidine deaminase